MPGHEPLELLLGHFHNLLLCPWPLVSAVQKPLVEQQKSVTFPYEALDLVRLSAAEHEQNILLKRVNVQLAANDRAQTVDTLTEVCVAASNVDPVEAGGIIQHGALPAAPDPKQNGLHPEFPECRPWWSAGALRGVLQALAPEVLLPAVLAVPVPMQYRLPDEASGAGNNRYTLPYLALGTIP